MTFVKVSINNESFVVPVDISIIESCKFTDIQIFVVCYLELLAAEQYFRKHLLRVYYNVIRDLSTVVLIRCSMILILTFIFLYFNDFCFCQELSTQFSPHTLDEDGLQTKTKEVSDDSSLDRAEKEALLAENQQLKNKLYRLRYELWRSFIFGVTYEALLVHTWRILIECCN